jgi:glutamine synthetase
VSEVNLTISENSLKLRYSSLQDTETGPGVFETALGYTQAQRMADNAVLFKLVAKSVGMKYGIMPTFMAKPWADVSLAVPCVRSLG